MTLDEIIDIAYPAALSAYGNKICLPRNFGKVGDIKAGDDAWGYVAINESTSTGLVAFRGTANFRDWIKDFTAIPLHLPWAPNAGCVHEGFALVYDAVRGCLKELLEGNATLARLVYRGRMIFTGHSLGASLATLAAYEYAAAGTELVTFAGPRVGTHAFTEALRFAVPKYQRVVNHFDIVPHVPGGVIYHHVGEEILIDGGMASGAVLPDLGHSHGLTTYLVGLEAKRAILHHADVAPIVNSIADTVAVVAG